MYFIFFGLIFCFGFIKSTDLKEFGDPSKSNAFTINRIHNKIPLLESKGRLYVPFIIRSHFPADFFSSQFAQYLRKYVQVLFKKHYPEHAVPYEQEHAEVNRSTHQTMDNGNTFSIYSSANLAPKTLFGSSNNMAVNGKTSHTGSKMGIPIVMPHKESSANQTEMVMGIPIHIHQLQNGSVNQDIPTFTVSNSASVLQSGNISMFGSFGFRSGKQQNKQGKGQTPADDNRNIIWINPSRITQIRKELKSNNNQNEVTNGGFQLIGNQQGTIEIGNEISSDKNTNNVKLSSLLGISTKSTGVHDQQIVHRTKSKGKDNFVIWQVPVFDNKQIMSSSGSSNGKHTKYEIKNAVKMKVERMKMPTIRNIILPINASSNDLKNRPGYKTINTVKQKGKRFKVKAKTHSMLPVDTSLSDLPMKKPKIKGKYRDVWKDLIVNSQKNTGQIPPVTQPRVHQKKRNFSKIPFHDRKMTENIMIKNTNLFPLNGKQKFVKPLSKSVIPEKSFLFKSIKKSIPSNDRQTITQEHNDINSISTKQKHEKRLEDMHNMDHTENSSPTTYERNTIHSSNIITKTNSPVRQSHNEDKLPSVTVHLPNLSTHSRSMTEPSYHTDQKENEQTSAHDSRRVAIYPYMDEQRVKQLKDEGMILHHNTEDNNETIFDIDNGNNIQHPSNEILSQNEERNKKENKIPQSAATNERNLQFIKKKIQSNRDQIRTEQINIRKNTILKADKIDDKDVSQNKIKTVGQKNRFHVKMNAIKMPHSEKDRNDIRNLTSLHNINDGYKNIEQSNRNKIQTDQINIRKKILLNAAQIKDKEMSQNKSKHEEQQKRINSRVNAIKMHHRETRIKMINNDRNAIKDQTSFQNSNDGNRNKKQSVGNQIRKERIDIPKKINLYTDKIKDKDVSQNERKTVGQQNIFQNKMNAFIMPHSDTSITINKKDRSIVRDLPSLQNPNDGDENKMKSNTNQRRTLHINTQKKIHLKAEKIKDKHVSQNAGKTLEQRNKFHSKMNAMPHSETIIINNKNDPSVIRDLTTFKHSNSGYKNKVQSNKDHIRIEHINTRKKIHLNAETIKDKDMSQNKRKTIGLQNKFHSKINAIKIPHSETIITINKKDRNSVSDLTSLQDSNNGYKNKVQSNTNQIRTEYINTPKKIILNADKIRDKPVSQNEINTLKQRNKLHSKWNAIKMPRSETSTKINENDLSAVRNLASLQSPVSGDKNKVQSIRDINRTEQINIRKKILLNADQFRAEQTDIRKKIILNADKIVDIDVSQNDSKYVGQQKNLKSQGTAIKMPHSETSIRMNKQDRNAIRNATSLQNLYDFDKSAHNKLHFKDKLNDSVRSRTKPVMGSLNSIQLADQFVHKRGKTVLKSKPGSYSGSSSIQKIQYNKDHLKEEYQEKANSNSSNKYVKKKRQFMKRTFKNQQGSELSLDNVINKNDQPTYKNQVLSDVGSHASNNENILKKPIEQTHANAENNNRPLSIDYYSVDYVSRQPMKEVLKDSNYKRNPSKNSQTKQTLEFQEIVQGNDRLSIAHLNKPNNGNYKSKRTEISPLKINTTSYIQTTVPVKHLPQQIKTVIPEFKRNVDFKNNDLQNNQQISTNTRFGEIKGKRNITPDVRYHNDIAPELQVTKQLHLPRSKGAIENENTYKTSIVSDTYDRNEQSNSRGGQIRMQTFRREPVEGGNSNIPTSKKESMKLSERNKQSTNDVVLNKSVGKLPFDKSFATDNTQDVQKSPHVQQSKLRHNNVKFKPIQNTIHFVKKRLPKRNTDRITTTKSIKLTDRRHQVNTDALPSISVQSSDKSDIQNDMLENLSTRTSNHRENNQVILSDHQVSADYPLPIAVQQTSSDKSEIQNDMLENLSTRTSNHRENNQVIPSDHQVSTDALPSISVKQTSDKSNIQNDMLENLSTRTSKHRENNQVIPSDHQVSTDALPSISVQSSDKSDIQNGMLENLSTRTSNHRENNQVIPADHQVSTDALPSISVQSSDKSDIQNGMLENLSTRTSNHRENNQVIPSDHLVNTDALPSISVKQTSDKSDIQNGMLENMSTRTSNHRENNQVIPSDHQVNTDALPSISVQPSDKSDIQNGMLENLSTRTSNHRENNQVIPSDHLVNTDALPSISVKQTSDKSDIQNGMLENLSTRTSNHRENNQVIPSDHQVNTDALPSISVQSSDKSDIQNDMLENLSTRTSNHRENNQVIPSGHQVNTDALPSISVQSSDKSDIQNGMLENLSTRTSNHRENNQVIPSDHLVNTDALPSISVKQTSDKSDIQNGMLENLSTRTSNHRENNQVIPSDHQVNTDALPSISVQSSDKSDIQKNLSTGTSHNRENNQNIRDTLPSSFTHRHSVIDSEANRENSEKQQHTASDHLKHIDKMVEPNDFQKTKISLHKHISAHPQGLKKSFISPKKSFISPNNSFISPKKSFISPNNSFISPKKSFISPKKMTGNVRQLIHSKFIRPRKLSNGVLTRRTNKEPIKTAVQNLVTQLITKVDDQKLNQQDTKQKTIFNHRHFDTSIKKQSVQSPLHIDYTKGYGIEAKSKISNPAYMNVMKAGLQKKEVYKGALDIQADDDNSDYYYDDEDDYDTTDVPGLKFTTKESYKNLKTPLKSIKNGEADINENEEYYEYDSYSDSFEDEDVLPEAKRKAIEQSRHTNELKFANPISNSNSKHSQKPPLNSQIDGDFSDYSESDYYSDSYYDDSDDSDVVTANNKDQSNDRNVNPQLSKTVSNVDSDLYYDDSSLPEDNTKYEYYDGSDSDMYYDESESDLSDKRQILTTDLQKPKTNTVPESDISKTIPPNLAKAYERIRKLCLCNYVNGRSPNGVLMQRNT